MSVPIISTSDLRKEYGEIIALDNVTLEVDRGAIAFLGPNGAGKTTFIKIVLGITRPTSGHFELLGEGKKDVLHVVKNRIGYMPEVPSTISSVTGIQYVRHLGMLSGMPYEVAMQRAHEVLDYVSLEEERYRDTKNYSTGMRQRLLLAQALVHDPEVIICDEPTSGLDPAGREDILFLLKDLVKTYGKSLFFSTHILKDVELICDDLIMLNHGKVVYHGSMQDLKKKKRRGFLIRFGDLNEGIRVLREKRVDFELHNGEEVVHTSMNPTDLYSLVSEAQTGVLAFQPYEISMDELFIEMLRE